MLFFFPFDKLGTSFGSGAQLGRHPLFRRVLCAPNEPRRNGILGQIILVDAGSVTLPLVIPPHP